MSALDLALRSSLVLAVGLVACAALRRSTPAARHAVLTTTLCIAPVIGPLAALLPPLEFRWATRVAPTSDVPGRLAVAGAAVAVPRTEAASDATPQRPLVEPTTMATIVWLVGALVGLVGVGVALTRLAALARRATPLDEPTWREALATIQPLTTGRAVRLLLSPRDDVLATGGWRRPYLLVPRCALGWPRARVDVVLAHELAHVRRRDWAWQAYASMVRAAFWWNPLAWIACRRLALEGERACDDAVLARGLAPTMYAEHLLAVARALHATPGTPTLATPMARPTTLHRRIAAMLDPRYTRSTPRRASLALLTTCLVALLLPIAVVRGVASQAPLEGVVYDPMGAVVPDVKLSLTGGPQKLETATDASGRFAFPGVDAGTFTLEAKLPGFRAVRQEIVLRDTADWSRVVTLEVGQVRETIAVRAARGTGAPPAAGPTPVRVGGNIRPPRKLVDVKPVYPQSMRDEGREGEVTIDAIIGRDGTVTAARVTSPQVHPDLGIAAVDAVRKWKFEPTLLNGVPIDVVMTVSISFTLE